MALSCGFNGGCRPGSGQGGNKRIKGLPSNLMGRMSCQAAEKAAKEAAKLREEAQAAVQRSDVNNGTNGTFQFAMIVCTCLLRLLDLLKGRRSGCSSGHLSYVLVQKISKEL